MEESKRMGSERRVGPYRLVRELGRGGMGEVFLAERADGQFDQTVALKIVHAQDHNEEAIQRFRMERQIVASLEHPHIARLLDGGVTSEGRPYFVMEWVDGLPVDRYCDEERLDLSARLHLFRTIGLAVQYAHRNLLVHRDLKPANIFVTRLGEIKLLDFGIARWLDREARTTEPDDETDSLWMTPEYASPEQLHDEPLTTASDQYQLGLLLFELLTGRRPYRLTRNSLADVVHAICEEPPLAPSTVLTTPPGKPPKSGASKARSLEEISAERQTDPQRLRRTLEGDLDAIVLKALAKHPEDRYPSVEQLVEDVERYLEGLPVHAREGGPAYRARKFVRRHWLGVATTLAFLALLLGYATTVTFQNRRIVEERDRAEAVKDFLVGVFTQADPLENPGEKITAQQLLDRSSDQLEENLGEQLGVKTELQHVIGRIYTRLGDYDKAETLLRKALAGSAQESTGETLETAQLLNDLAMVAKDQADYRSAEDLHRESLRIRRSHLGKIHPKVSGSLHNLARVLESQGRFDEAEPLFRQALQIDREVYGTDDHRDVSFDLNGLGSLLARQGRFEEAEAMLHQALDIRLRLLGADHPTVATSFHQLADLERRRGEFDAAREAGHQALGIHRRAFGETHWKVARDRALLGRIDLDREHLESAEAELREARALLESALGPHHHLTALAQSWLGTVRRLRGHPEEAMQLHNNALAALTRTFPDDHPEVEEVRQELLLSLDASPTETIQSHAGR